MASFRRIALGTVAAVAVGAGLYWGIQFVDKDGTAWKSDIWGWEPDDYIRRQKHDADLIAALEQADRTLILRLKTEAHAKPGYYGVIVGSWDIYQFVLAGAGTSLIELEAWKARDPLTRVEAHLRTLDVDVDAVLAQAQAEADELAAEVRRALEALEEDGADRLFDEIYAEPHQELERQRREHALYLQQFDDEEAGA